ncbi:hypothetical protein ACFX15_013276 [Malus domestica]
MGKGEFSPENELRTAKHEEKASGYGDAKTLNNPTLHSPRRNEFINPNSSIPNSQLKNRILITKKPN